MRCIIWVPFVINSAYGSTILFMEVLKLNKPLVVVLQQLMFCNVLSYKSEPKKSINISNHSIYRNISDNPRYKWLQSPIGMNLCSNINEYCSLFCSFSSVAGLGKFHCALPLYFLDTEHYEFIEYSRQDKSRFDVGHKNRFVAGL